MKNLLLILFVFLSLAAKCQQGSIQHSTYRSALLDTTTVYAPANTGVMYYSISSGLYWFKDGTGWHQLGQSSQARLAGSGLTLVGNTFNIGGTLTADADFNGPFLFRLGNTTPLNAFSIAATNTVSFTGMAGASSLLLDSDVTVIAPDDIFLTPVGDLVGQTGGGINFIAATNFNVQAATWTLNGVAGTAGQFLNHLGQWATPVGTPGSGTVTSIVFNSPLTGGTVTSTGTIGIQNALANSTQKGAATFNSTDFNDNGAGLITIDWATQPTAGPAQSGKLSFADWNIFNNKAPTNNPNFTGAVTIPTLAPGTNTTGAANTAFVQAAIAAIGAGSGTVLDVTGTANRITISGTATLHPVVNISTAYAGQTTITTVGGLTGGSIGGAFTPIAYQWGGIGLNSLGAVGQSIRVNATSTGYEFYTPAGGFVNTAGANEMIKSDGTNGVPSGLGSTNAGDLDLGLTSTGASFRLITAKGSGANIGISLVPKGSGQIQIGSGYFTSTGGSALNGNTGIGTLAGSYNGLTHALYFYEEAGSPSAPPTDGIYLWAKEVTASNPELLVMDQGGATVSLTRPIKRVSTSTAGATITLDMGFDYQRMHDGSAAFATAKAIAMSNETIPPGTRHSEVFSFVFTVTSTAAVLTPPATWQMSNTSWNGTTWTPASTGKYEFGGRWDGSAWIVKAAGPFN